MASELLYFGTDKPQGQVSEQDWRAFIDAEVTPRFPLGLSVWSASGQWRSNAGPIVREASHVLSLVHEGTPDQESGIGDILSSYKARFAQEAVLRVKSRACVSF